MTRQPKDIVLRKGLSDEQLALTWLASIARDPLFVKNEKVTVPQRSTSLDAVAVAEELEFLAVVTNEDLFARCAELLRAYNIKGGIRHGAKSLVGKSVMAVVPFLQEKVRLAFGNDSAAIRVLVAQYGICTQEDLTFDYDNKSYSAKEMRKLIAKEMAAKSLSNTADQPMIDLFHSVGVPRFVKTTERLRSILKTLDLNRKLPILLADTGRKLTIRFMPNGVCVPPQKQSDFENCDSAHSATVEENGWLTVRDNKFWRAQLETGHYAILNSGKKAGKNL